STRNPSSIQRALLVRLGGVNVLVITPKVAGLCRLSDGLLKFGWLNTVKKSAEKRVFTRSVIFVVLPRLISKFLNGSRSNGLCFPLRVSLPILTQRMLLITASGLLKRFMPVPAAPPADVPADVPAVVPTTLFFPIPVIGAVGIAAVLGESVNPPPYA